MLQAYRLVALTVWFLKNFQLSVQYSSARTIASCLRYEKKLLLEYKVALHISVTYEVLVSWSVACQYDTGSILRGEISNSCLDDMLKTHRGKWLLP